MNCLNTRKQSSTVFLCELPPKGKHLKHLKHLNQFNRFTSSKKPFERKVAILFAQFFFSLITSLHHMMAIQIIWIGPLTCSQSHCVCKNYRAVIARSQAKMLSVSRSLWNCIDNSLCHLIACNTMPVFCLDSLLRDVLCDDCLDLYVSFFSSDFVRFRSVLFTVSNGVGTPAKIRLFAYICACLFRLLFTLLCRLQRDCVRCYLWRDLDLF